jgi:tetratricopeptide (TPR) repeat protein
MARALAHKRKAEKKSRKIVSSAQKARSIKASKSSRRTSASKAKTSSPKAKSRVAGKRQKGKLSHAKHTINKENINMEAGSRKPRPKSGVTSAGSSPPRLLNQTKTTSAALALLEKGIELIFKRDFKKARAELNLLLATYPDEMDILARARSYIQICDREEANQIKPAVTTDQLYALGVLEHNRANYDEAISYFLQSLENHPDADYIYYSVAASQAMKGDLTESIKNLRKAVELNEDSRIYAKNDMDFSALQSQKEFAELVGFSQSSATEPQK